MKQVLLIDDCPMYRMLMRYLFSSYLYYVKCYPSVEKLPATIDLTSYDLIVSDYNLPGLSGYQFLKLVRDAFPDSKLVLLTGNRKVRNLHADIDEIANRVAFKPLGKNGLDKLLKQIFHSNSQLVSNNENT